MRLSFDTPVCTGILLIKLFAFFKTKIPDCALNKKLGLPAHEWLLKIGAVSRKIEKGKKRQWFLSLQKAWCHL